MIWIKTEEELEIFIKENRDKFDKVDASMYHTEHFLFKLHKKFKQIISIIPYLVKVFIVAIIVFAFSILAWNSWIRKDRHEVTLKQKIENIIHIKK